jgi:hypothetical protein
MLGKRTKQAAALEAESAEDQAAGAATIPANLAAEAEQRRYDAERIRDHASQGRVSAQGLISMAEQEAAERVAAAKAEALAIVAEAVAGERQAAELEERARYLDHAVQLQAQAGDADRLVADLEAERAGLVDLVADLGSTLENLRGQREDLTGRLDVARGSANAAASASLLGQIAGVDDVAGDLASRRQVARERAEAIGDGEGTGTLAEAREAASVAHSALRQALNVIDPSRPEARHDAAMAEVRGALDANMARLEAERKAADQPRTVVHL